MTYLVVAKAATTGVLDAAKYTILELEHGHLGIKVVSGLGLGIPGRAQCVHLTKATTARQGSSIG